MHRIDLAVVGAGPVGLTLALHAARALPLARVTLHDARSADLDMASDPRVLALSLGSVHLLERLQAFDAERAEPILEVQVSQEPSGWSAATGERQLRIRAAEERVPMLGAVLRYGAIVAPLQAAWHAACEREPQRLAGRFGIPVAAVKNLERGVEVDCGIAQRHDLAVIAEGGVFAEQSRKALALDYAQSAWVGQVATVGGAAGVAYERFTRHGPLALLPLRSAADQQRCALVWCVPATDDPVAALSDEQRLAVLNTIVPAHAGRLVSITPLKRFALGLNAEHRLSEGRSVRIGNAAQTLHPVAGQGLNLGLRDAFELVRELRTGADIDSVLRRFERHRASDRWSMIAATDFLARSFRWRLPGAGAARALGLAALDSFGPARSALARQMMFGLH